MVKHAPVEQGTQETQVLSLGREDPFEEMATCSSIVARKSHERISVRGEVGFSPWGHRVSDMSQ